MSPIANAECASGERPRGAYSEGLAVERLGRTLKGKWTLDSVLGAGGMATVYAATHRNGNRVAVKMLHPGLASQTTERERFLREGFVSNKVDHPDVARVLDEDVDEDGSLFLVMELLDGESIVSRWDAAPDRRLPPPEALWIADRLLSVLEAAHAAGIIHRDIKPENLFLTSTGQLKVLDFGIARLGDAGSGCTMQGFVLGTPGFTAPEQARGEWDIVDARADLWAVGATLFALMTGRFVHDERTPRAQLLRTSFEPAPPVHEVAPTMPAAVARLLDRALAFLPQDRFQTAAEMRKAVRTAFWLTTGRSLPAELAKAGTQGLGPPSVVASMTVGPTKPTESPQRTWKWTALAGAATICVVAGGIVLGSLASAEPSRSSTVVVAQPSVAASTASVAPTATNAPVATAGLVPLPPPPGLAPIPGEAPAPAASAVPRATEASAGAPAIPIAAAPAPALPAPIAAPAAPPVPAPAAGVAPEDLPSEPAPVIVLHKGATAAPANPPIPPSRAVPRRPARAPSGSELDFVESRH